MDESPIWRQGESIRLRAIAEGDAVALDESLYTVYRRFCRLDGTVPLPFEEWKANMEALRDQAPVEFLSKVHAQQSLPKQLDQWTGEIVSEVMRDLFGDDAF